eukprot:COSAG06_NODE_14102_length_1190_cov_1.388634_2_plen_119_part_01
MISDSECDHHDFGRALSGRGRTRWQWSDISPIRHYMEAARLVSKDWWVAFNFPLSYLCPEPVLTKDRLGRPQRQLTKMRPWMMTTKAPCGDVPLGLPDIRARKHRLPPPLPTLYTKSDQ